MPCLVYCVTQPIEIVSVTSGVCESDMQSLEYAGLRAYWSEMANPDACLTHPEAFKKATLQFRQVLREILAAVTPIPLPFPTLLESVEALEQFVGAEQE